MNAKEKIQDAILKTLMVSAVIAIVAAGAWAIFHYATEEDSRKLLETCIPLFKALIVPLFITLLVCLFYKDVKMMFAELPGFVHRSRYGVGDAIADDSVESALPRHYKPYCIRKQKVNEVIKNMIDNGYSYAPIIDLEEKVAKVFSIVKFTRDAVEHPEILNLMDTTFATFEYGVESPRGFKFCSEETVVIKVRGYFWFAWENRDEFKPVFITDNGQRDGKFRGLITMSDVFVRK